MTPEELRRLMSYLAERVELADDGAVRFALPSATEMVDSGFPEPDVKRLLAARWIDEMVTDVRETADFCEPDAPAEQVLQYARDTVVEFLRKRFEP